MDSTYRQELNRLVKTVLVKNFADTTIIQWTCSQNTATLFGALRKYTGETFTVQEIDVLVRELARLPNLRTIRFNLTNWEIGATGDSWHIKPKAAEKTGRGLPDKVLVQKNTE